MTNESIRARVGAEPPEGDVEKPAARDVAPDIIVRGLVRCHIESRVDQPRRFRLKQGDISDRARHSMPVRNSKQIGSERCQFRAIDAVPSDWRVGDLTVELRHRASHVVEGRMPMLFNDLQRRRSRETGEDRGDRTAAGAL